MADPYKVLGVKKRASNEEVQAAYRAAAKKAHPDAGGRNNGRIQAVNDAWEAIQQERRLGKYRTGRSVVPHRGDPPASTRPSRGEPTAGATATTWPPRPTSWEAGAGRPGRRHRCWWDCSFWQAIAR